MYRGTRPIPHLQIHMYHHLHVCVCACVCVHVCVCIGVCVCVCVICGSILYVHILQQMTETSTKHFSLDFNCGFAWCAICELNQKFEMLR